jgi:hypothetical protein
MRTGIRNPRILFVLLLVFLCGSAAGALGTRLALRKSGQTNVTRYWREGGREISVQKFRDELELTNDQTREVESVLDDFMMYYQTLQAQMDEVRADGKERILRILNPEQRDKFKQMITELQAKQIR